MTQKRIDTDAVTTNKKGIQGLYELFFRKFQTIGFILSLSPMYVISAVAFGLAATPAVLFFRYMLALADGRSSAMQALAGGLGLGIGYFIYGFSLMVLLPVMNFLFRCSPKPARGSYYSAEFVRWYLHNTFVYLMRYTFLFFITPTPFNVMFFKWMGMKIGRGTQINTENISDPALIVLEDKVTIGGSVTLIAHYGQGGYLILAPTIVRKGATIGLRAIIMGGADIGQNAKVLPNSVVMPKTVIPAGETWGGIPAQKIDPRELAKSR